MTNEERVFQGEIMESPGAVMQPQHIGVPVSNHNMPGVTVEDIDVDRGAELARKRTRLLTQYRNIAFEATNERDWVDSEGSPYLQISGVDKVATAIGISYTMISPPTKYMSKDNEGEFYIYRSSYRAYHPYLGSKDATGEAMQRDKFFGYTRKNGWKKTSEINEVNISKKSATNAISRCVCALLGLKNLTWEEVNTHFKKQGQVKGYSYQKQNSGNNNSNYSNQNSGNNYNNNQRSSNYNQNSNRNNYQNNNSNMSGDEARAKLTKTLNEYHSGDQQAISNHVENLTAFPNDKGEIKSVNDISKLSDKWAISTYNKLMAELKG